MRTKKYTEYDVLVFLNVHHFSCRGKDIKLRCRLCPFNLRMNVGDKNINLCKLKSDSRKKKTNFRSYVVELLKAQTIMKNLAL